MKHTEPIQFWRFGQIAPRIMALLFAVIFGPQPATAAENPADVAAYCAKVYGAGTTAGTDRRDNGPLCTQKKALSLTHYKVDPAEICRTLYKAARYRQEGPQIFCLAEGETPAPDREVDLTEYCRKNYGQSAIVSRRQTDNAPLCTVKGDGGLSQTHYAIDLAQLCGTGGVVSPAAVDGDTLDCAKAGTAAQAGTAGKSPSSKGKLPSGPGGPSGPKQAGTAVPVPETAIIRYSKELDLTGCGVLFPPKLYLEKTEKSEWRSVTQQRMVEPWNTGRAAAPCRALSGGYVPDLKAFCSPNTATWLPEGRPICNPPDTPLSSIEVSTFGLQLFAACWLMYPKQDELIQGKIDAQGNEVTVGRLVPVVKFAPGTPGKLECFYIEIEQEAVLKLVERTDGVIREVTGALEFYGGPFFYQVRFNETRSATTLTVAVTVGSGDEQEFELSRVEGDDRLYRSEAFFINAPISLGGLSGSDLLSNPGEEIQP